MFIWGVIIIVLFYYYYMHHMHPTCPSVWYDDQLFKTGDIILFKSQDNLNSLKMFNYYTHIGVVIIPSEVGLSGNEPHLWEAANLKHMNTVYKYTDAHGILLTPLRPRIHHYKGLVFWRSLITPIDEGLKSSFGEYIAWAREKLYYDEKVIRSGTCRRIGYKPTFGTNCGELTFLSLIRLGILPRSYYNKNVAHYLKWMGYVGPYRDLKKIKVDQFIDKKLNRSMEEQDQAHTSLAVCSESQDLQVV
jgi:hypothetical protein